AYVERLIGTLRRDCLDHVLIFHGRHLRRVLTLYRSIITRRARTWRWARTHRYDEPSQRSGTIVDTPISSGLHHQYARMGFSGKTEVSGCEHLASSERSLFFAPRVHLVCTSCARRIFWTATCTGLEV